MQRWPRLEGPGWVELCPVCPPPQPEPTPAADATPPASPETDDEAARRFRELISPPDAPPGQGLPESLLEDLPEDARKLLSRKPDRRPDTGPLPEQLTDSLARQGYVVSEDAHGVRLTGAPRSGGTGGLSASDVVRMAADLGGGVLPTKNRARCPKCDAVVPVDAIRCEWCGEKLAPAGSGA